MGHIHHSHHSHHSRPPGSGLSARPSPEMKASVLGALLQAGADPARALAAIEPLRTSSPRLFAQMFALIGTGDTPQALELMSSTPTTAVGALGWLAVALVMMLFFTVVGAIVFAVTR
jgi:hypothetical protein